MKIGEIKRNLDLYMREQIRIGNRKRALESALYAVTVLVVLNVGGKDAHGDSTYACVRYLQEHASWLNAGTSQAEGRISLILVMHH